MKHQAWVETCHVDKGSDEETIMFCVARVAEAAEALVDGTYLDLLVYVVKAETG